MDDIQYGDNVQAFVDAGMLSADARSSLSADQIEKINAWDTETVQRLLDLYRETGPIPSGLWI
jgi:hypothetical protein